MGLFGLPFVLVDVWFILLTVVCYRERQCL